jgi:hypothetical protein
MAKDVEHFFMWFWPFVFFSFEKVLFSSFVHFFIGSLIFGKFKLSSLYILVISQMYGWQRFPLILWAASLIW